MAVAVARGIAFWRSSALHESKLVKTLLRDQAVFFLAYVSCQPLQWMMLNSTRASVCSVCHILQIKYANSRPFEQLVLEGLGSPTLLCVLGSRLFFSLKEAGGRHKCNPPSSEFSTDDIRLQYPLNIWTTYAGRAWKEGAVLSQDRIVRM